MPLAQRTYELVVHAGRIKPRRRTEATVTLIFLDTEKNYSAFGVGKRAHRFPKRGIEFPRSRLRLDTVIIVPLPSQPGHDVIHALTHTLTLALPLQ